MNNNRIVNTGSIPPQKVPALPVGANNIYQAGMITAQKDAASLNQLIGGKKRRKKRKNSRYKGGASQAVILAPSVPSYATGGTQNNYNKLAQLGMNVQNAGVFDKTVDIDHQCQHHQPGVVAFFLAAAVPG
jgi:hypothetical protein